MTKSKATVINEITETRTGIQMGETRKQPDICAASVVIEHTKTSCATTGTNVPSNMRTDVNGLNNTVSHNSNGGQMDDVCVIGVSELSCRNADTKTFKFDANILSSSKENKNNDDVHQCDGECNSISVKNEDEYDDDDEHDYNSYRTNKCDYDDRFDDMEIEMLYDAYETAWNQLRNLVESCKSTSPKQPLKNNMENTHSTTNDSTKQLQNVQSSKQRKQRIVAWLVRPSERKELNRSSIQVTIGLTLVPFDDDNSHCQSSVDLNDNSNLSETQNSHLDEQRETESASEIVTVDSSIKLSATEDIQDSNRSSFLESIMSTDGDNEAPIKSDVILVVDDENSNGSEATAALSTAPQTAVTALVTPLIVSQNNSSCCSSPSHSSHDSSHATTSFPVPTETNKSLDEINVSSVGIDSFDDGTCANEGDQLGTRDHQLTTPKRANRSLNSKLKKTLFTVHKEFNANKTDKDTSSKTTSNYCNPIIEKPVYNRNNDTKIITASPDGDNADNANVQMEKVLHNYNCNGKHNASRIDDKMLMLILQSNSAKYNLCYKDEKEKWKILKEKPTSNTMITNVQLEQQPTDDEMRPPVSVAVDETVKLQQTTIYVRKIRNSTSYLESAQYFYSQEEVQKFLLDNYQQCSDKLERRRIRREHKKLRKKANRVHQQNGLYESETSDPATKLTLQQSTSVANKSTESISLEVLSTKHNNDEYPLPKALPKKKKKRSNEQVSMQDTQILSLPATLDDHQHTTCSPDEPHSSQQQQKQNRSKKRIRTTNKCSSSSHMVDSTNTKTPSPSSSKKKSPDAAIKDNSSISHKLIRTPNIPNQQLKKKAATDVVPDMTVSDITDLLTSQELFSNKRSDYSGSKAANENENIVLEHSNNKQRSSKRTKPSALLLAEGSGGSGIGVSGIQLWCQRPCTHPKCWEAMWDHLQTLGWTQIPKQEQGNGSTDEIIGNDSKLEKISEGVASLPTNPVLLPVAACDDCYYLPPKNGKVEGGRRGTHFFESSTEVMSYYRKRYNLYSKSVVKNCQYYY